MTESERKKKPKPKASDIAHSVVKAGLSAIPFVGGPAAELFNTIIAPPLAKRRDEWMESIADGLRDLEEKVENFKIEDLAEDEMFITAVIQASRIAVTNHQKEKLEALRNAVLNSALRNAPEEDIQLVFLNFVDVLTPWHLRVLKFFDNPLDWAEVNNINYPPWSAGAPATALEFALSELSGRREFYDKIVKDLYSHGLFTIESLHVTMTVGGMLASRTTEWGKSFIRFISDPMQA